uniref:Uncharacterized protein n=1 Tax=Anguilla anguilla TaxID=7936 RepID=A0A0E9VHX7_ANGAN
MGITASSNGPFTPRNIKALAITR